VPPTFLDGGDIICHVTPLFSLRVCIWRGFKTKCDVCHVLREEFFILDVTHSYVDDEREFGVVSLILVHLYIFTSKLSFSILQVSRDHKRLLTASARHLFSVVYCNKGHCLETVKYGCTRRDHRTAVICFVQKHWLTGFTVTLVVTYSKTDRVKFKDASV